MIEPLVGNCKPKIPANSPQAFYVKIRRGTAFSWWTSNGETMNVDEREDIGSHREAHVISAQLIQQSDVDGTEVEMVTK